MKNVVILYKNEDGNLYCRQITEAGKAYVEQVEAEGTGEAYYWEEGGTILLEELEEILDKEI
jgi:hypothetical protein